MISRSSQRIFRVSVLSILLASHGVAQAPDSKQTAGALEAAGAFEPTGPPSEQPIRVDAGESCIVDLRQGYVMSGTLTGSLEIDYRILVRGPCEVPPVLGKYDEEWIAHGVFTGTLDGSAASGNLSYTAHVRPGGDVRGRIVLGGGFGGELTVSGNFAEGQLSYSGWAHE